MKVRGRSRCARVLLVESDPTVRRSAARLLASQLPLTVVTAQHAFEAIAWATAGDLFDVAILDANLRELDATAARLRELSPSLRCVVWSVDDVARPMTGPSPYVHMVVLKALGEDGLCSALADLLGDVLRQPRAPRRTISGEVPKAL